MCAILVTCPAGQQDVNDTCKECPIGSYKEAAGPDTCDECAQGLTTSGTGSTDESANCSIGKSYPQCISLVTVTSLYSSMYYILLILWLQYVSVTLQTQDCMCRYTHISCELVCEVVVYIVWSCVLSDNE